MNIVLTGGARGLGKAITERLCAARERRVYFTFCASAERARELERRFENARGIPCDFRDGAAVERLVGMLDSLDPDVVIHNAIASVPKGHFEKLDPACFEESFRVNVMPVIRITQKALAVFRRKRSGKLITILTAGLAGPPPAGWSEYTAQKAYLLSLHKSWAVEHARFNISSNCISPALMETDLTADMDARVLEALRAQHPQKKLLTCEEVAASVEFFVDCSPQINGTNQVINAGAAC